MQVHHQTIELTAGRTDKQESALQYKQPGRAPELEADLVVPLARGAVRDRIRADRNRDLYLLLRDQRPRDGRAQQVYALVQRVCPGAVASMRVSGEQTLSLSSLNSTPAAAAAQWLAWTRVTNALHAGALPGDASCFNKRKQHQ